MQPLADAGEGDTFVLAWYELIREHADIRRLQFVREIDKAASLVHMLRALGRIGLVHLSGSAEVGNLETGGRKILQRSFQPSAAELGHFGQIHLILDAAQLERSEAPLRRILDDRVPVPLGAAECRDGYR